jgi:hypothetical protein
VLTRDLRGLADGDESVEEELDRFLEVRDAAVNDSIAAGVCATSPT